MVWKLKSQLQAKFFIFILLILQLSTHVHSFPFDKASGVMELSPDTIFKFSNSHKPTVILFYASWCGHCRSFHDEYKKFADAVKGSIRVGAIDAHTHKSIAQQFSIQGFPTIKYWKMGNKSIYTPHEYRGPRMAASLMSLMINDIQSDHVAQSVRTPEDILDLNQKSHSGKVAVLFSSKKKVPPIFSILSISPRLQNMTFVFVHDKDAKIGSKFGITKIPSLAVMDKSPAGQEDPALPVKTAVYPSGNFSYEAMAKFVLFCLQHDSASWV
ncbi:unnamed protein product [Phytomonas sp. Hart1]|nr:unnamed protein product [Phytomonas sp. Hart1]|eukprot:CCW66565.1 unnamed protein product [Phytomonas sp. isolate Hart1]